MNESGASSGRSLAIALLILVGLTASSWGLSHVALGAANTAVALLIAAVKASVVAFVFMELAHASTAARVVVVVTLFYIALICTGMIGDTLLR